MDLYYVIVETRNGKRRILNSTNNSTGMCLLRPLMTKKLRKVFLQYIGLRTKHR